ncbi:MAG: guanylate kinase [Planctomycetes bacterium]|nr:guanylate kinase [Planctomycetota bacterium]
MASSSGKIVILSGPSGVGKTSICQKLLERPARAKSTSATTRPPRPGEIDGVDYHFLSREEFEKRLRAGWFAEHAEVHAHLYGTPRHPLEDALQQGVTFLLDIDVQGAERIRQRYPGVLSIFILPPSTEALEKRLRGRRTDSPGVVERRLARARAEIARQDEFDYRVVNDRLERVVREIEDILERPRPGEQNTSCRA